MNYIVKRSPTVLYAEIREYCRSESICNIQPQMLYIDRQKVIARGNKYVSAFKPATYISCLENSSIDVVNSHSILETRSRYGYLQVKGVGKHQSGHFGQSLQGENSIL